MQLQCYKLCIEPQTLSLKLSSKSRFQQYYRNELGKVDLMTNFIAYAIRIKPKIVSKPILMNICRGIPWAVKVGSYSAHDRRNLRAIETISFEKFIRIVKSSNKTYFQLLTRALFQLFRRLKQYAIFITTIPLETERKIRLEHSHRWANYVATYS